MRLVHTFGSRFEAEQFVAFLNGSGVEAMIISDDEAGLLPALSYQSGVKVYVHEDDFSKTIKLMNSFQDS
ncbi:hypothetical protein [Pseudobacteriovorax antillogorgiicola]|uniref:Signal transducing protein n=1 Tax=Pseudobacteriovorax antillogorgiicola TaxID=1513793 RepID=A0A1Y6CCM6_9BACT|nr:hypothetical protein [Pseudobacteriovorax antillogorgiicola]TCS48309.1 hypothetical protein EDD56_11889 [Pseudobacteriovorax antillogorgiicola]SMF56694.1 hypothetical protein SAMN06296036_11852 [Pseudobacteriovorax antillogorgiicola]